MSSPRSWLLLLLLNLFQFALSVDAKGGGKSSSSSSSPKNPGKGSKSSSTTSETVVYQTSGKCYNNQCVAQSPPSVPLISSPLDTRNVLIQCPYSKSTVIITIIFGAIAGNVPRSQSLPTHELRSSAGILLLVALGLWLLSRWRSWRKSRKLLDAESKGKREPSEVSSSSAPLVHGEKDEKDGEGDGYSSDGESTYYDPSDEKPHKY